MIPSPSHTAPLVTWLEFTVLVSVTVRVGADPLPTVIVTTLLNTLLVHETLFNSLNVTLLK